MAKNRETWLDVDRQVGRAKQYLGNQLEESKQEVKNRQNRDRAQQLTKSLFRESPKGSQVNPVKTSDKKRKDRERDTTVGPQGKGTASPGKGGTSGSTRKRSGLSAKQASQMTAEDLEKRYGGDYDVEAKGGEGGRFFVRTGADPTKKRSWTAEEFQKDAEQQAQREVGQERYDEQVARAKRNRERSEASRWGDMLEQNWDDYSQEERATLASMHEGAQKRAQGQRQFRDQLDKWQKEYNLDAEKVEQAKEQFDKQFGLQKRQATLETLQSTMGSEDGDPQAAAADLTKEVVSGVMGSDMMPEEKSEFLQNEMPTLMQTFESQMAEGQKRGYSPKDWKNLLRYMETGNMQDLEEWMGGGSREREREGSGLSASSFQK